MIAEAHTTSEGPQVWTRVALVVVALQQEVGISNRDLFAGLPFDEQTLKRRTRIAWKDYATLADRMCAAVGGLDEYEDLFAAQHHQVVPEMRSAVGAVISPNAFMRFMVSVVNPLMMPPVHFTYDELENRRVRITATLRPDAHPCEAFLRGGGGALRGMTRSLDLPMSKVIEAHVTPTSGMWILELPQARTLLTRAYRRAKHMLFKIDLGAEADGRPVSIVIGLPDDDPTAHRMDKVVDAWKLTERQADVLRLVIEGRSNKEIAQALGCAENTVELHITRLLRKTDTSSRAQLITAFWSGTWGFPH
jgi:DNA-binding CsgD family transcriptional regulator